MPSSAAHFLSSVIERYRGLASYRDVGLVYWPGRSYDPFCWFKTLFAGSEAFRFEFVRPHPSPRRRHLLTKYAAGVDAGGPYFFTQRRGSDPQVEAEESVDMAVAGATGISRGSAFHIAQLLFPSIQGNGFLSLKRLKFRRSSVVNGVKCDRVSGLSWRGSPVSIWIGVDDLLIRKITSLRHEESRFDIVINETIPPSQLERVPRDN